MKVLLSIKPEFAYKIFSGEKKYEFRRTIFKNKEVTRVIVYASAPVKKVIGEFEVDKILTGDIDSLWHKTGKYAGITKDFYDTYFSDKEVGHAIKVKSYKVYRKPLCIKKDFNKIPPQSFVYL